MRKESLDEARKETESDGKELREKGRYVRATNYNLHY